MRSLVYFSIGYVPASKWCFNASDTLAKNAYSVKMFVGGTCGELTYFLIDVRPDFILNSCDVKIMSLDATDF